jgi:tRNA-2-methylthio-N6-dimethylallyladenosine synthase
VEGPSRKDPNVLTGRTRQNKLVHFAASAIRPGTYATVAVTGAAPHHLRGDLVEVTRPAAHKTRLPLLVG